MLQRAFASGLIAVALVALVPGCAAFSAAPAVPNPGASARDLTGTWNGQFWILGGFYYPDEGILLLEIKADGTFTVRMTPTAAANNIAKPSSWSGTVSTRGRLVVFHTSKGPWDSLLRSGDILYGLANDPATGADIGIKFERAGSS
jgi:hypothetical protein